MITDSSSSGDGARRLPSPSGGGTPGWTRRLTLASLVLAACGPPAASRPGAPDGQAAQSRSSPAPAPAAQGGDPGSGRVVPLEVIDLGVGSTLVMVRVSIRGQGPFAFVLDTGASKTALTSTLAGRLQLPPVHGAVGAVTGVGSTGRSEVLRVDDWKMGEVQLPPMSIVTVDFTTSGGSSDGAASSRGGLGNLDGLLGSDVLSHFGTVTIDYRQRRLTLPAA